MSVLISKMVGVALLGAVALFLVTLLATGVGALLGWSAGILFPDVMARLAELTHMREPYQVGAALGFVSAFFRSNLSKAS